VSYFGPQGCRPPGRARRPAPREPVYSQAEKRQRRIHWLPVEYGGEFDLDDEIEAICSPLAAAMAELAHPLVLRDEVDAVAIACHGLTSAVVSLLVEKAPREPELAADPGRNVGGVGRFRAARLRRTVDARRRHIGRACRAVDRKMLELGDRRRQNAAPQTRDCPPRRMRGAGTEHGHRDTRRRAVFDPLRRHAGHVSRIAAGASLTPNTTCSRMPPRSLWRDSKARHDDVCAALSLTDRGPGSVELAMVRSGSAPGKFTVTRALALDHDDGSISANVASVPCSTDPAGQANSTQP